ncbi:MAG: 16S rRNA (guanine(527)-N(7))-methyltransferase RsmG [Candidatus Pelagadaptatus aseana]|uniref:16S rRNA (guanine(527)-N(7))-methyltransferase RsmG n=1 Tax=Candidatus Pelagadaptatus aseana TaxID=3120508 RepID=UPI0039B21FCD
MMTADQLQQKLLQGALQQGISVSQQQAEQLVAYLLLFEKWNKAYNLSAVRDIEQMLSRHILDSLSVVPYIDADNYIDVGTGGGLPGIPLAIMFPEKTFTLLDSNGKKSRFQFQAVTELNLTNVSVHNGRVEQYQPPELFDGVISRAFASLKDMTDGCHHLLKSGGNFLAMKGIYPQDELSELAKNYKVSASYPLQVSGEEGERHLLIIAAE